MLAVMEPRWSPKDLKLIFADQLVTDGLLHRLDIKETCVLRGDYHHLMNEVWPRTENFGLVFMTKIRPWLKQMLLSPYEKDWHRCYSLISRVIETDPDKMIFLDTIYSKPSYYAGYFLRSVEGNLKLNGSVPAEQNHASTVAYLGEGGKLSICQHFSELMLRQQNHTKVKKAEEDDLYVKSYKYISKRDGQFGIDEVIARKSFSSYAFNILFQGIIEGSLWLQSFVQDDGKILIWKAGCDRETCHVCVIDGHGRCDCHDRISFMHQCKHEYFIDGKLIVSKWDSMWYSNHFFRNMFPSLAPIVVPYINDDMDAEFVTHDGEGATNTQDNDDMDAEFVTHDGEGATNTQDNDPYGTIVECGRDEFATDLTRDDADINRKISYQEIMTKMGELARTIQNDKSQCAAVFSNVNRMIELYRNGKSFELSIISHDAIACSNSNKSTNSGLPLAAVTKALTSNATRTKRKQSALEYQRSTRSVTRASVSFSQNTVDSAQSNNDEIHHLPSPKVRTRRCVLCGGKGHGQFTCVKLLRYGNTPLEKNNISVRQQLSQD